jgi:hypothetical protein
VLAKFEHVQKPNKTTNAQDALISMQDRLFDDLCVCLKIETKLKTDVDSQ